jgi:hypothetical protein
MALAFNPFRASPGFARSAVDTVVGAAGTKMALRALRRYPKTAIALGVLAGVGAVVGGLVQRSSDEAPKVKSRKRKATAAAAAA